MMLKLYDSREFFCETASFHTVQASHALVYNHYLATDGSSLHWPVQISFSMLTEPDYMIIPP